MKLLIHKMIMFGLNVFLNPTLLSHIHYWLLKRYARHGKKERKKIIWGFGPLINVKYWAMAVKSAGYDSVTMVAQPAASINKKSDYDLYYEDVSPKWVSGTMAKKYLFRQAEIVRRYSAAKYVLKNAALIHVTYEGGPLSETIHKRKEAELYALAGIKMIGSGYGGDVYMYSRINDLSIRHVLNAAYPKQSRNEEETIERVNYWNKNLDCVLGGFITDGRSRWDILFSNPLCIDLDSWNAKTNYSLADGNNAPVKIIHISNHHHYTGTVQIVNAINELKAEGLKIDFFYPENKIPNEEFRQRLAETDIMIDGLIFSGYGMAAIEAMAIGTCSIVNLETKSLMQVFRRYSFLNECPLASAEPESLKNVLRILIKHPELRKELGLASRKYVEKYHSFRTVDFWFGKIYDKLINCKEVALHDIFNPNEKNSYNNKTPLIEFSKLSAYSSVN